MRLVRWKTIRHDPLWGPIPEYRFPYTAYLLREAHYHAIHKPLVYVSYLIGILWRERGKRVQTGAM